MKKGGGRLKGGGFERQVSRLVLKAFKCYGIKKKDCYRTPGSGGHRQASKFDPGDLVISRKLRKYFPFSVECKFYKRIKLDRFMVGGKSKPKVHSWCKQCLEAASKQKRMFPLLVMKENRGLILCSFPVDQAYDEYLKRRLGGLFFKDGSRRIWKVMLFAELLKFMVEEGKGK